MAGGDYTGRSMEIAQRRGRVVAARDADGLTFRAIAEQECIDVHTAFRDYQRARRDAVQLTPEALERAEKRKLAQLARIDEQRRDVELQREAVMEVLGARHLTISNGTVIHENGQPVLDDAPVLQAVDRLVKLDGLLITLDDQEAKLLGLYAEKKVSLSGGLRYDVVGINPQDLV